MENITADVYQQQWLKCKNVKLQLIESNRSVTTKSGNCKLGWSVTPDSAHWKALLKNSPPWVIEMSTGRSSNQKWNSATLFGSFSYSLPGDWKKQFSQLSKAIESKYKTMSKNKAGVCCIKQVTEEEFFIFFGTIIFSGAIGKGGKLFFEKEAERQKERVFHMSRSIDLSPFMAWRWFEDIKTCFPNAFVADFDKRNSALENHNPWYMLSDLIDEFNKNWSRVIAGICHQAFGNESLSAWRPRKN